MPKLKVSTKIEHKGIFYIVEISDNVRYENIDDAIAYFIEHINVFNDLKIENVNNLKTDNLPF